MPKFRKKPVEIEAVQIPKYKDDRDLEPQMAGFELVAKWCGGEAELYEAGITLDGVLAVPGDMIHKREDGTFYILPQMKEAA